MNVWQHKANTFSDRVTIKTVEVYHVINFFMQVGMYTCIYICIHINGLIVAAFISILL